MQKRLEQLKLLSSTYNQNLNSENKKYEADRRSVTELEELVQSSSNSNFLNTSEWKSNCQAKIRDAKQKIAKCDLEINRYSLEINNAIELLYEKQTSSQAAILENKKSLNQLKVVEDKIKAINVCIYLKKISTFNVYN